MADDMAAGGSMAKIGRELREGGGYSRPTSPLQSRVAYAAAPYDTTVTMTFAALDDGRVVLGFAARQFALPWLSGEGDGSLTNQFLWPGFSAGWPSNGPAEIGGSWRHVETFVVLGLVLLISAYPLWFAVLLAVCDLLVRRLPDFLTLPAYPVAAALDRQISERSDA